MTEENKLPAVIVEILPAVSQAALSGDLTSLDLADTIARGQIGRSYPQDKDAWRPWNKVNRFLAEKQWDRRLRDERQIAIDVLAAFPARQFAQRVEQTLQQQQFDHQQAQVERSQTFFNDETIRVTTAIRAHETDQRIREAQELARLQRNGQQSSDTINVATRYIERLAAIENDPALSDEAKHRRTEILREALKKQLQQGV